MGSLFEGPKIATPKLNQSLAALTAGGAAKNLKPLNLNAGGLKSRIKGNNLNVSSTGARSGLVNSLYNTSLNQADLLAGLRGGVSDATSGLTASRLAQIEDARKSSASTLRDNLARRKILGSSFASDAQTRNELDFARQRDQVAAEGFLQELDLTQQLATQEYETRLSAFNSKLGELNLQGELGANLASQANDLFAKIAQLKTQAAISGTGTMADVGTAQAKLDAEAQAGAGKLIGQVAGIGLAPFTGGASLALAM